MSSFIHKICSFIPFKLSLDLVPAKFFRILLGEVIMSRIIRRNTATNVMTWKCNIFISVSSSLSKMLPFGNFIVVHWYSLKLSINLDKIYLFFFFLLSPISALLVFVAKFVTWNCAFCCLLCGVVSESFFFFFLSHFYFHPVVLLETFFSLFYFFFCCCLFYMYSNQ